MQLAHYIGFVDRSQTELAHSFRQVADSHAEEADVFHICSRLARQCDSHVERLGPFTGAYGEDADDESAELHRDLFGGTREGPIGLLRDLHDLYVMAAAVDMAWTVIAQAAQGARDPELLALVEDCEQDTSTQMDWLRTRIKQAAPQALVVA